MHRGLGFAERTYLPPFKPRRKHIRLRMLPIRARQQNDRAQAMLLRSKEKEPGLTNTPVALLHKEAQKLPQAVSNAAWLAFSRSPSS